MAFIYKQEKFFLSVPLISKAAPETVSEMNKMLQ